MTDAHRILLPDWIGDQPPRSTHDFGPLTMAQTALLVVDLQNAFMQPGYMLEIPKARTIVPTVNRLVVEVRERGGTVVFLRHTMSDEPGRRMPDWQLGDPDRARRAYSELAAETDGNQLDAGLDFRPSDLVVRKYRPSAFLPGSSDLDSLLHERGVDTIVITGVATNVCCESTARDANMLDYKVYVVADATAAANDDLHNAALLSLSSFFARIVFAEDLLKLT